MTPIGKFGNSHETYNRLMRHNLEAFAVTIGMRYVLSLGWFAGRIAGGEQVWRGSDRE